MFLHEVLDIVKPDYVVTLGAVALKALGILHSLEVDLSKEVGRVRPWNGYQVFPLFHPGPRAMIWRAKMLQTEDYKALAELLVRRENARNS